MMILLLPALLWAAGAQTAPTRASTLAATGSKHLEENRPAEAKAAFEESLKLDPDQFDALSGMGFLHFTQEQFAEARGYLQRAVAARPKSFQSRFLLGATLVQLKDSPGAIAHLRHAHVLNPGHADARKLLGAQYVESRRFIEAIRLLEPPSDEETHLLLIEAHQGSGDSARAFALASAAARHFPESAQIAAWVGFQLQFAGRYDEAKRQLHKAIELDPSFPVTYQILGEVFLKEENYSDAAALLRRAAEMMPDDTETLLGLSRALAETGGLEEALELLRQAARNIPSDARVHLQLSRLYFRLGDEPRAKLEAELSIRLREVQPPVFQLPPTLRRK